jgi:alpha-beta hydrolase superfamily lysophospholipase
MKKTMLTLIGILLAIYLILSSFVYLIQERLIFYPTKLPENYTFRFADNFKEQTIQTSDGKKLHGLLFKASSAKGLIFYLHGNAGALDSWGQIAGTYTSLQYDVFMLDYRGFGKSEGNIISEKQFYSDVQEAYAHIKRSYRESDIIITGFSIGSAAAAMLASTNQPRMLILQAPYYSLRDLMKHLSPLLHMMLPPFVLKYKFKTYQFIQATKAPIMIFHGDRDEVIYHGSSLKLSQHLKPADEVITLKGQTHNGINENRDYIRSLRNLLE